MVNVEFLTVLLLLGLSNVHAMSIKRSAERSEDNLEKVDESAYKVNYDVYPVRWLMIAFTCLLRAFRVRKSVELACRVGLKFHRASQSRRDLLWNGHLMLLFKIQLNGSKNLKIQWIAFSQFSAIPLINQAPMSLSDELVKLWHTKFSTQSFLSLIGRDVKITQ
jgi:hypothetical protein